MMPSSLTRPLLGIALVGCVLTSGSLSAQSERASEVAPKAASEAAAENEVAPAWGIWRVTPGRTPKNAQDVYADQVWQDVEGAKQASVPWVRAQALQEASMAYGAQAGLHARTTQIEQALQLRAQHYARAFNFAALQLEPGLLPPVIEEGRDAYQQSGDSLVRAASRIYRILFPARLVNTPPIWEDYLLFANEPARLPHPSLLPKTPAEKALWNQWADKGWREGVEQADAIFEGNLARLQRDFEGMIRYKMLYQQGIVQKPLLASSHLGVTGGGTEMALDDRIYEITVPAALDPDISRWRTTLPRTHHQDTQPPPPPSASR